MSKLLAALAVAAYLVQPGDTISGIAAAHGTTVAAVEAANPQIANPNLIYAGQSIKLTAGPASVSVSGTASAQSTPSPGTVSSAAAAPTSSDYSSSSLSDIPGVPQSLAACVAFRESTDLQNPAANGNAYGIIPSSGINVEGKSLAAQKAAFAQLYQEYGGTPWAADGCPGT